MMMLRPDKVSWDKLGVNEGLDWHIIRLNNRLDKDQKVVWLLKETFEKIGLKTGVVFRLGLKAGEVVELGSWDLILELIG